MKLKYFLLFAASVFLTDVAPSLIAPAPVLAQYRASEESRFGDACQATKPAVVTIYAGREIGSGSIVGADGLVITNFHVVNEVARSGSRGQVSVRSADGDRYPGQVIATDRQNDLALIQLRTQESLPTVPLASTSGIRSGQQVCAIGSPFGRPGVLTRGTLSRVRQNGDLQSNVVLNPGNSGGPLLNAAGEMIGINKAILQSPSGRNTGISFATSAQVARSFIERNRPNALADSIARAPRPNPMPRLPEPPAEIARLPIPSNDPTPAEIVRPLPGTAMPRKDPQPFEINPSPSLGPVPSGVGNHVVTITDGIASSTISPINPTLDPDIEPDPATRRPPASGARLGAIVDIRNLMIRQIRSGSPAALGGLKPGDRLLAVNGEQLADFDTLMAFLQSQPNSAIFTVNRNQKIATIRVSF